jgi:hypothetical protein
VTDLVHARKVLVNADDLAFEFAQVLVVPVHLHAARMPPSYVFGSRHSLCAQCATMGCYSRGRSVCDRSGAGSGAGCLLAEKVDRRAVSLRRDVVPSRRDHLAKQLRRVLLPATDDETGTQRTAPALARIALRA